MPEHHNQDGLDEAMGIPQSRIPWVTLVCGLTGAAIGFLMQTYLHGGFAPWLLEAVPFLDQWDYPLIISGKPIFAWPTYIPITFEIGVLLGAFGSVIGILAFCRLPRWYNSLFHSERFERVTDDKFFIAIEATDPAYDAEGTAALLRELGATHVELVEK